MMSSIIRIDEIYGWLFEKKGRIKLHLIKKYVNDNRISILISIVFIFVYLLNICVGSNVVFDALSGSLFVPDCIFLHS